MRIPNLQLSFPKAHGVGLALALFLAFPISGRAGEETNAVTAPPAIAPADMVNSYVQLQAQLHATQMALEQNRKEIEGLAARNSEALAARLEQVETALAAQRAREDESANSRDRLVLWMASAVGGMGLVALLLTGYLQWRTVNRLATLSTVLADTTRLALPPVAGLSAGEVSSLRLLGALGRLEQRLLELENTAQPGNPSHLTSSEPGTLAESSGGKASPNNSSRTAILLAKGQSLLSLGQLDSAMGCFDEILAHHPDHPEALVKKGLVLERQQKPEEALQHYDRAIASNGNFTQAYLQKAALCNRLGRYDQAVASYEQVLRVREDVRETERLPV